MKANIARRFQGRVAMMTASIRVLVLALLSYSTWMVLLLSSLLASCLFNVKQRGVFKRNVDETVTNLAAQGIEALGIVCHVSNSQQRKNLSEKTVQKYGQIDVFVSNATVNPSVDSILETKETVLDKLQEINVKSSVLLQDAAPHLQKGSSVVIISSIAGYQPPPGLALYGVTKQPFLGSQIISPKYSGNCVAPGFVPTRSAAFLTESDAMRKDVE